jgi:hypothetical protein
MIDDMRLLSHAKSRDPQSDDNLHIEVLPEIQARG